MAGAPRAKRHHFVPRLHLRRFVGASPKNMIWTFDNQRGRWRNSTIENTAVQSNFYSVAADDGPRDDIEHFLSRIESDAAEGYAMLMADEIPSGQVRADFAMFLATMHLRTPATVNALASGFADMMNQVAQMTMESREEYERFAAARLKETGEKTLPHEELLEFLRDTSRYDLNVLQERGLMGLGAADRIAPILYNRNWYTCTPLSDYFITSDNPVHRWTPAEHVDEFMGDGGFLNPHAEVTFPLAPDRLLLIAGTGESVTNRPITLPPESVDWSNEKLAYSADRYIYSDRRSDEIAALALKHKDVRPGLTVMGPGERANIKVVRKLKD